MYLPEHVPAWKVIVDFVHEHSRAKICLQLGHSGPKGSTKLMWEGMDEPLDEGNWPVVAPSAVPYAPANQIPSALSKGEMQEILAAFVRASEMGLAAERASTMSRASLRAHGYLLSSSFITPLRKPPH